MDNDNTSQRILTESLRLFSEKGYEAVSVEQIAKAVGIKAPSLYKHFKSKRTIFNAIFSEMQKRFDAQTEAMNLHISDMNYDTGQYDGIFADELFKRVDALFEYSLHDDYVARFRRLMTIEQFGSPEMSALYTERYVIRMLEYHECLFHKLMEDGILIDGDARSMAWQYVAPVQILLSVCDRQPERESEVKKELKAHIQQFYSIYQNEKR